MIGGLGSVSELVPLASNFFMARSLRAGAGESLLLICRRRTWSVNNSHKMTPIENTVPCQLLVRDGATEEDVGPSALETFLAGMSLRSSGAMKRRSAVATVPTHVSVNQKIRGKWGILLCRRLATVWTPPRTALFTFLLFIS